MSIDKLSMSLSEPNLIPLFTSEIIVVFSIELDAFKIATPIVAVRRINIKFL